MRTVRLEQRTEEWKRWRKEGITATDSPVLLGLDPDKSIIDLWSYKTGRSEPPDLSAIPAVRYGVKHEDYARSLWEVKHVDLAPAVCGEWDENPFFRASFDGLTADNEVLEIKCPLPGGSTLMDVEIRGTASEAYRRYYVQVQHQLLVCGGTRGHLIFLVDKERFIEFEINRDEAVIQKIIAKGEELLSAMQNDVCPTDETLWHPKTLDEEIRWNEAAASYLNAQRAMKSLREAQAAARKTMQALMGNYQRADLAGLKVTKTTVKGTVSLPKIVERLKEKGIEVTEEVLSACQTESSERWSFKESANPSERTKLQQCHILQDEDVDDELQEREVTWF